MSKDCLLVPACVRSEVNLYDEATQFDVLLNTLPVSKLNIYFLIHASQEINDMLTKISAILDDLAEDLKERFREIKIGIGKFSNNPTFQFIQASSGSTSE
ncbi:hypothetical protein RF11_00373 [Thelohanellus kitauei]|uniref:Uncharacterized protein n=1 Tax=Thelohanellus kitauei TaxID=669202 RepID=A0A0C2NAZ1_THEKT|nr:hypothetical protein RF11_00373 [Thelohanellus kitauei]